jgi:hypothetical protein
MQFSLEGLRKLLKFDQNLMTVYKKIAIFMLGFTRTTSACGTGVFMFTVHQPVTDRVLNTEYN